MPTGVKEQDRLRQYREDNVTKYKCVSVIT